MLKLTTVFLLMMGGAILTTAQNQPETKTYLETRKLLLKLERSPANKPLERLFEEEESRRSDLIQALDDPDQKVSLNAQTVIKYVADPLALAELDKWYEHRRKTKGEVWVSPIELLPEVRYLEGEGQDLPKLASEFVFRDSHLNTKDIFAEVVAYNKRSKTALIEVVVGNVFTDGRHLVVRRENGKWRLLSISVVWQS